MISDEDFDRLNRKKQEARETVDRLVKKYFPDEVPLADATQILVRNLEIADFMHNQAPEPDRSEYVRALNKLIS